MEKFHYTTNSWLVILSLISNDHLRDFIIDFLIFNSKINILDNFLSIQKIFEKLQFI